MVDEKLQHLFDVQGVGAFVDECDVGDCESGLQQGVSVQLVHNDAVVHVSFQVYRDSQALAVGFVSDVGDFGYRAVLDTGGGLGDDGCLDDHVVDFGYDDADSAFFACFDMAFSADP